MSASFEIQLIAIIISVACALPGTFLVLRKMSMMTDSITHTILLGIVIAFFATHDLSSPLLIIGAGLMGVVTVWLTETIVNTKIVSEDASIGLVFPLLFSIAIILITRYAGSTHLCEDSVLLGELAFAPFNRMVVFGVDIGAKAIYTGLILLIINFVFIAVFYKELKIATFDPLLASVLGLAPVFLNYGLMTIVSVTTVVSFEAVGSILVIAFMIGPPVTAYLLTDKLHLMLILSAVFGAISGIAGYQLASIFDVSIAGSMAVMMGVIFFVVFICAPQRGLVSVFVRRRRQKSLYAEATLLFHLNNHQDTDEVSEENGVDSIRHHLRWEQSKLDKMLSLLIKEEKVEFSNNLVLLTQKGKIATKEAVESLLTID